MDLNVLSTHLANKDNSNITIKYKLNTSKDNQKAQQKSGYKTLIVYKESQNSSPTTYSENVNISNSTTVTRKEKTYKIVWLNPPFKR